MWTLIYVAMRLFQWISEYFHLLQFVVNDLFIFVVWIWVFGLHVCLLTHASYAHRCQKKVKHPLEMEFQTVIDFHISTRSQN